MCGIAGLVRVGTDPGTIRLELDRMWPWIASRGPDGRGELAEAGVGLLHSRLAIIDLVSGHQPIWNEKGTVGCIFNGEIYNYRRLRAELQERGHTLSTTSDTEVLVHLYEEHGDNLVEHIHGMYAFALYDREKRRVLLARDRLGIKPLYLAELPNGVAFASAIGALTALGGVSREPDFSALVGYLRFYKVYEPCTSYRGVSTLLAGPTV